MVDVLVYIAMALKFCDLFNVAKYAVVALAWMRWVRPNPSIFRRGFSNPSIFEKESMKIQLMGSRTLFSKCLNPSSRHWIVHFNINFCFTVYYFIESAHFIRKDFYPMTPGQLFTDLGNDSASLCPGWLFTNLQKEIPPPYASGTTFHRFAER